MNKSIDIDINVDTEKLEKTKDILEDISDDLSNIRVKIGTIQNITININKNSSE